MSPPLRFPNPTLQRDPHQEHKEDKEDIGDKVGWSQDAVGIVDSIVVKIPKDDLELSETERPGSGIHPEPDHNADPIPLSSLLLFSELRPLPAPPPNLMETEQGAETLSTHTRVSRNSHRCLSTDRPTSIYSAAPRIHTSTELEGEGAEHTHGLDESVEAFHLGPKKQVAQLGVGEKLDEEHDGEAQDVLGTAGQPGGELDHGLIEADVLEYLEGPC